MDGCLARTITKIEANPLLVRGKSDFRIVRVAAYCVYLPMMKISSTVTKRRSPTIPTRLQNALTVHSQEYMLMRA